MNHGPDSSHRRPRLSLLAIPGLAFAVLISALVTTAVASSAPANPLRAGLAGNEPPEFADSLAATKDPKATAEGLSSRLAALSTAALRSDTDREQALALSTRPTGAGSLVRDGDRLVTSARVGEITDRLLSDLQNAGAEVLGVHRDYLTVDLAIAAENLRDVAAVDGVESVTEALEPMVADSGPAARQAAASRAKLNTCTGSIVSEADSQLRAAEARAAFGIDGTGAKVGVLSDSFDTDAAAPTHAGQDVASADLPGPGNPCGRGTPVQVIADQPAREDEGRAMLQLVHDIAPGASLAFATAFPSAEGMADNIRALQAAGSNAIVDDINYFDEPMFQDGPISNAVNDVTAAGVPYFSAAANSNVISTVPIGISGTVGKNIGSYEAPSFRPAACAPLGVPGSCMDFNPTATTDNTSRIVLNGGRSVRLDLQWAQPRNGVTTDLDIYVVDPAAALVVAQSADDNFTTQKPFELVNIENPTGAPRFYDIYVNKFTGTANPRFKWVMLGGSGVTGAEYDVSFGSDVVGPTIFGHNGAANTVSTAAVPFNDSNSVEKFSSRGPVTLYFGPVGAGAAAPLASPQVLAKPDIAATDGAQTTFFTPSSSIFRFFGTSAAAPHAAAVAALQIDAANGSLSVPQIRSAQTATAAPVGFFGPDAAGSGLVNAVGAVGVNPPQPPTTTITKMPKNKIHKKRATYAFASNAPEASFQCRIDRDKFRRCPTPVKVVGIPFGRHQFSVRAVANGLTDSSPAKDRFKRK